jgi:apolipoprotein N-acyltransferase
MHHRVLAAALVVVGGVSYGAAFPPHQCALSAWITLVPLLCVAARTTPRGAFAAGFGYGAVLYAATVPWVLEAVEAYFHTGPVGALAFSAAICVLFVSLWVGLFAAAARALLARGPWEALATIPALWVSAELARTTLLSGLPWELLGHALWHQRTLIQVADLAGVYALSYVVAAVNVGVYLALRALARTENPRRIVRGAAPLAAALGMVVATAGYGTWRLAGEAKRAAAEAEPSAHGVLVALVQGIHLAPGMPSATERQLIAYARRSQEVVAHAGPDLLVWPEYAVGVYPEANPPVLLALADLARRTTAGIVFGAPRAEPAAGGARYFNSAWHMGPEGRLASYDKVRPVPFAESRPRVPGEAFAFGEIGASTFSAGSTVTVFTSAVGRLGVLICYEVIFPGFARDLVRAGAEVLLNLSNDAWLDRAGLGAGVQDFSIAVFRAVETRRYLARASASGISGFIDPTGRPFGLLATGAEDTTTGIVHARREITPYVRCGDAFAVACVAVGGATLITRRRRPRRRV